MAVMLHENEASATHNVVEIRVQFFNTALEETDLIQLGHEPEADQTSIARQAVAFDARTTDDSQDEPPSPRVLNDDFGF